ncbi:hypothetical protein RFF05_16630 [Bengtsoniella intestinalis]|uniref:hypothetical protein n=1 Tax=Bengtsoniella intestinalis TaxID=3073143 RepID=UPI00391F16EC
MKKSTAVDGIRIGDWWLLGLFAILIAQSVYGLFFPLADGSGMDSIDVVFRTSEAAIFGYIISGNFGKRQNKKSKTTQHTTDATAPSIGFDTQDMQTTTAPQATATTGKRTAVQEITPTTTLKKTPTKRKNTHQLTLVGIIGVMSLLILVTWRNFYGSNGLASTNMTAVITQYRDMVSGCVGFLIGQPQATELTEDDV